MNKQQQKDFNTVVEVANVELNVTGNTCTLKVPIEIPLILKAVLLKLLKHDPKLFSHIMGETFLKIIQTQLHQQPKGGD